MKIRVSAKMWANLGGFIVGAIVPFVFLGGILLSAEIEYSRYNHYDAGDRLGFTGIMILGSAVFSIVFVFFGVVGAIVSDWFFFERRRGVSLLKRLVWEWQQDPDFPCLSDEKPYLPRLTAKEIQKQGGWSHWVD